MARKGGLLAFGLLLQSGGTSRVFLLQGCVVLGDHGRGHSAGPAFGVGEPGAVPGESLELEAMPPEEDVSDACLPGKQARRADLGEFGGERLVSRCSAAQSE